MIHTDAEPTPRKGAISLARRLPAWPIVTHWQRQVCAPADDFLAVLNRRRSREGGPLDQSNLAALLRHSTMLRERRSDGRFGVWESRAAPAAGGIHALLLLCLPLDDVNVAGIYDVERHALLALDSLNEARLLNRNNVSSIADAKHGTTLQIVADLSRYEACYDHWESLMWRDAGVLTSIISLVATLLGLVAIPLGRHGNDVVRACHLDTNFIGAGAVHLGANT